MRNFWSNQKGQTIIEIVAAIAIGTLLIFALVALSIRSNRGADFSRVENQAAKLASEGIEIIRSIKASGGSSSLLNYRLNCTGTLTSYTWNGLFGVNDDADANPGGVVDTCNSTVDTYGRRGYLHRTLSVCNDANEPWCLTFDTTGAETIPPFENRTFQRYVYVSDSTDKSVCNTTSDWNLIKQFTVVVSWIDSSGDHEVKNTTCLQLT